MQKMNECNSRNKILAPSRLLDVVRRNFVGYYKKTPKRFVERLVVSWGLKKLYQPVLVAH